MVRPQTIMVLLTPKEAARLSRLGDKHWTEVSQCILEAPPCWLQEFIHELPAIPESWYFNCARVALDIQLSDQAAKSAERLEKQVIELVGIAAEQKRLAAKLDVQTDTLISLTRWLRGLTIALVVLAIPLFLEALHFIQIRKDSIQVAPHIQQSNQPANQNGFDHHKP